jgi:hypothetical protein
MEFCKIVPSSGQDREWGKDGPAHLIAELALDFGSGRLWSFRFLAVHRLDVILQTESGQTFSPSWINRFRIRIDRFGIRIDRFVIRINRFVIRINRFVIRINQFVIRINLFGIRINQFVSHLIQWETVM